MDKQEYISYKIKKLLSEGKSQPQAIAIAINMEKERHKMQAGGIYNNPQPFTPYQNPLYGNFPQMSDFSFQPQPAQPYINPLFDGSNLNTESRQQLTPFSGQQMGMADLSTQAIPQANFINQIPQTEFNPTYRDINRSQTYNPYTGVNLETALFTLGQSLGYEGENRGANTLRGIAAAGKIGLGGARTLLSGVGYQNRNYNSYNNYLEQLYNPQFSYTSYQEGGEVTNADVMTGAYIVDNPDMANVEIEKNEIVQDPLTGDTRKAIGDTHENGGIKTALPSGSKILSDHTKIGAQKAKLFKKEFDIKVKATDTFAKVMDKYNNKIGFTDLIDEEKKTIEQVGDQQQNEIPADTKDINMNFLSEKLQELQTGKELIKPLQDDAFNLIFKEQEKVPKSKQDDKMQEGGMMINTIARDNISANRPMIVNDIKDKTALEFTKKYIASDEYLDRLKKSGHPDPKKEQQERLKTLSGIKIVNQSGDLGLAKQFGKQLEGVPYSIRGGSQYQGLSNAIIMNSENDKKSTKTNPGYNSVLAHELAHSELWDNKNKGVPRLNEKEYSDILSRLKNYNDIKDSKYNELHHDNKPDEIKADLNSLKYHLYRSGIYDATEGKEFKKEDLNKLRDNIFVKERLLKNYKEDDLIWLMNNIAQTEEQDSNMAYAQEGGQLIDENILALSQQYNLAPERIVELMQQANPAPQNADIQNQVVQALQQGAQPQQVLQQLMQSGMPQEQAQQLIDDSMQLSNTEVQSFQYGGPFFTPSQYALPTYGDQPFLTGTTTAAGIQSQEEVLARLQAQNQALPYIVRQSGIYSDNAGAFPNLNNTGAFQQSYDQYVDATLSAVESNPYLTPEQKTEYAKTATAQRLGISRKSGEYDKIYGQETSSRTGFTLPFLTQEDKAKYGDLKFIGDVVDETGQIKEQYKDLDPTTKQLIQDTYQKSKQGSLNIGLGVVPQQSEVLVEGATPQVINRQTTTLSMPNLPIDFVLPPDPNDPVFKASVNLGTIDPVKLSIEPNLIEADRQRQSTIEALSYLPDSQRAAAISSLLGQTQTATNQAITATEQANSQAQYNADLYNTQARDKQQLLENQFAQQYEQNVFRGLSNTRQDLRAYFNELNDINRFNFNYVDRRNAFNQAPLNYKLTNQGVTFEDQGNIINPTTNQTRRTPAEQAIYAKKYAEEQARLDARKNKTK